MHPQNILAVADGVRVRAAGAEARELAMRVRPAGDRTPVASSVHR